MSVTLFNIPRRARHPHFTLRVTLDEHHGSNTEGTYMRCLFNTQIAVDIDTEDDALRKAFIDLIVLKARELSGVATMLSKGAPKIEVSMVNRDGKTIIPLFAGATRDESDD